MRGVGLVLAAAVVVGAGIGHALLPVETSGGLKDPYCWVNSEVPAFLTVAGPADGVITVDGRASGVLVGVDEEVAGQADPFDGILFNVPGPGTVAVDGVPCDDL